jgi:hypothetical protein
MIDKLFNGLWLEAAYHRYRHWLEYQGGPHHDISATLSKARFIRVLELRGQIRFVR